jgi:hypothetical protein
MRIASIYRLALGAFAASLLAPAAARAEDFTFTVPVDVRDLPSSAHGGGVRCEAWRVPPPPLTGPLGDSRLPSGETHFPLTHGGFQGNVTVRFNAKGEVSVADAKGYRCWLYYLDVAGKDELVSRLGHRSGTPYTAETRGALNP